MLPFLLQNKRISEIRTLFGTDTTALLRFLKQHKRESTLDFASRTAISYMPAAIKIAFGHVLSRLVDNFPLIVRNTNIPSYNEAIGFNVDGCYSTLNAFMANVARELLLTGTVAVVVDRDVLSSVPTLTEIREKHPYLGMFPIENISDVQWEKGKLTKVTLSTPGTEMRTYEKQGATVTCTIYSDVPQITHVLDLTEIPVFIAEISSSIVIDAIDHAKALLNLASADMGYILNSELPFLTVNADQQTEVGAFDKSKTAKNGQTATATESVIGRIYARGMERPGYIAPPSDPVEISLKKQQEITTEISQLIGASLDGLSPTNVEQARAVGRGRYHGMSIVAAELLKFERFLVDTWSRYEKITKLEYHIEYPDYWEALTEEERLARAKSRLELLKFCPSQTFKKLILKALAFDLLGGKVTRQTLETVNNEIEKSTVCDPDILLDDIEKGILSLKTAALSRGYSADEVDRAATDHAERLLRIVNSQMSPSDKLGARGIPDMQTDPQDAKAEKAASQNADTDPDAKKRVRGKE